MNIKKVVKYVLIIIALLVVLIFTYKGYRKEAGRECNSYAFKESTKLDPSGGIVIFYEPLYVSCMRGKGYLLGAREITTK